MSQSPFNQSPITLEALSVLDAIEQQGSFAKAAQKLNKVPSALSYIVQKLEQQLDITLFIRQGRRSILTPAGKHLLREGRTILTATNKLTEQTKTIANGWEPRITIAIDSIVDTRPIFNCLKGFMKEHPNIEIDISEEVLHGTWESLVDDKVGVIIGASSPVPSQHGISARKLSEIQNVFVVHKSHCLIQEESPITNDTLSRFQTVVTHDSAKKVIPWNIGIIENSNHFYVPTIDYKIKAIMAGLGGGFLPTDRIEEQLQSGELVQLALTEEQPTLDLFVAWKTVNQGKGLTRLRELLLNQ